MFCRGHRLQLRSLSCQIRIRALETEHMYWIKQPTEHRRSLNRPIIRAPQHCNEHLSARRAPVNKAAGKPPHSLTSSTTLASHINVAPPCPSDSVAQRNFASIIDEHGSSRRSVSGSVLGNTNTGSVSLRKQLSEEEQTHSLANTSVDDSSFIQAESTNATNESILKAALDYGKAAGVVKSHDRVVVCQKVGDSSVVKIIELDD